MSRETRNSELETGGMEVCKHLERQTKRCAIQQDWRPRCPCVDYEAPATRSSLDDDEARLQRWCDRTERLAEGVAVVAMSLALIVFALIAIEWVRLYRSLPPGSMRLCGFVL